ncbi:MAG: hypothetical protein WDN08_00220 [Rhizomicrobium sp.]
MKYYLEAGKGQPSFSVSVSDQPQILASSLPERVVRQTSPAVFQWVQLNAAALLSFWNGFPSGTKATPGRRMKCRRSSPGFSGSRRTETIVTPRHLN